MKNDTKTILTIKHKTNKSNKAARWSCLALTFSLLLLSAVPLNAQNLGDLTGIGGVSVKKYPDGRWGTRIQHNGGYVATIEIYSGHHVFKTIPQALLGEAYNLEGYSNYRIRAWAHTGLVWAPKKLILDEPLRINYGINESDKYLYIEFYGTTLDPKWKKEEFYKPR